MGMEQKGWEKTILCQLKHNMNGLVYIRYQWNAHSLNVTTCKHMTVLTHQELKTNLITTKTELLPTALLKVAAQN